MPDPTPQPTPTPTDPDIQSAPPSAPDLSGLTGPAPAPPTRQEAVQTNVAPYEAQNAEIAGQVKQLAQPTPAAPPGPHAKLLSMVAGLALGLDSFGKSIATQGKEGGATEVQQVRGEQQRQQIEKQQAAQAQKNAQMQQLMTVYDTNQKQMQSIINLATLPNQITESDLKVKSEEQGLETGKVSLALDKFNLFANTGLSPDGIDQLVKGGTVDAGTSNVLRANAQQQYHLASQANVLPPNDPYLTALKTVLDDPNSPASTLVLASKRLQSEVSGQKEATAAKTAAEAAAANSPVGKLSTPEALAQPGAAAAIQAKIADPTTDPNDIPRLRALIPQAVLAQHQQLVQKQREDQIAQTVAQGDPNEAGKLLAARTLTLDELKLRNATPQFIESAVKAAQTYDPSFRAPEAAAQAAIARSAANQQFFGNTDSLLIQGGTLDQLDAARKALGNTTIPKWNTISNLAKASVGQGPQAAIAATMLGVADDYSKVMTGGQGSDTSRQQALDIMNRDLSPAGGLAASGAIRAAVESQRNGRVGTNPYLKDMYPDPSLTRGPSVSNYTRPANVSAQAILMQAPGGQPHWIEPDKVKTAQALGATELK